MIALSLIAVVYIGLVALVQQDMKKLIAYSSIAHMGFVTLGSFLTFELVRDNGDTRGAAPGPAGRDGADDLARLHLRRDVLLRRRAVRPHAHAARSGTTAASSTRCRCSRRSWCCSPWPTSGLPGTSGFVGEFMVILASFQRRLLVSRSWPALTLILGAAYTLWLVKRVIFGEVANEHVAALDDINVARVRRARRVRASPCCCSASGRRR